MSNSVPLRPPRNPARSQSREALSTYLISPPLPKFIEQENTHTLRLPPTRAGYSNSTPNSSTTTASTIWQSSSRWPSPPGMTPDDGQSVASSASLNQRDSVSIIGSLNRDTGTNFTQAVKPPSKKLRRPRFLSSLKLAQLTPSSLMPSTPKTAKSFNTTPVSGPASDVSSSIYMERSSDLYSPFLNRPLYPSTSSLAISFSTMHPASSTSSLSPFEYNPVSVNASSGFHLNRIPPTTAPAPSRLQNLHTDNPSMSSLPSAYSDRGTLHDHSPQESPYPRSSVSTYLSSPSTPASVSASALSTSPPPEYSFDEARIPSENELLEAAKLPVIDQSGNTISFGSLWMNKKTVVVFIRHFWCPLCQDYMFSISRNVDPGALKRKNVNLIVISNGSHGMIKAYRKIFRTPFALYTDPTQNLYNALGMTLRTLEAGPEEKKGRYVRHGTVGGIGMVVTNALKVGMPVWEKGGDIQQLGGEFILGPGLRCTFAHRMKTTRAHAPILKVLSIAGVDMYAQLQRLSAAGKSPLNMSPDEEKNWMARRKLSLLKLRRRKRDRRGGDEYCGGDVCEIPETAETTPIIQSKVLAPNIDRVTTIDLEQLSTMDDSASDAGSQHTIEARSSGSMYDSDNGGLGVAIMSWLSNSDSDG